MSCLQADAGGHPLLPRQSGCSLAKGDSSRLHLVLTRHPHPPAPCGLKGAGIEVAGILPARDVHPHVPWHGWVRRYRTVWSSSSQQQSHIVHRVTSAPQSPFFSWTSRLICLDLPAGPRTTR